MLDGPRPLTDEEQRERPAPIDPAEIDFEAVKRLAVACIANLIACAQRDKERPGIIADVRAGRFDWAIATFVSMQANADFDTARDALVAREFPVIWRQAPTSFG